MTRGHETFEHTADIGIRAFAESGAALFEEAAVAMFQTMYRPTSVGNQMFEVEAVGATVEDLLVAWLSELLVVAEAEHVALSEFEVVEWSSVAVKARVSGSSAAEVELEGSPVKAVTYHGLKVTQNDAWKATVIFDV